MNPSNKPNERKKSILVPTRIMQTNPNAFDRIEETEIAAEISIPSEGGWGWVVVVASFTCTFILDGTFFTFGAIYPDMAEDLGFEVTLLALINSVAVALYFITGPVTSALINRFGFRACTMSGSIILSVGYLCSYFATSYLTLLTFYGVISGFGGCLVSMPSAIVVGFYFERLRALALAISGTGSSVGIMLMFTLNSYLVNFAGWRITTLFHSGLFGTVYFLAMSYRPLLSLTVTKTTDDPTRTITYLPSLSAAQGLGGSQSKVEKIETIAPTTTERLFSAVSNSHFPTAATVVEEGVVAEEQPTTQAGPSSSTVSKLTLTARSPQGGISQRQLKQVQSIISRASVSTADRNIEVKVHVQGIRAPLPKKQSCWGRLCHWERHIPESRPMYRDDAFYEGRLENLPIYRKSIIDTAPEARTGLEYHMAVSRAVTTADLEEGRGVFTTAVRRILATMMDPKLLKRCSFLIICCSGFLTYVGLLVPYVFVPDRSKSIGIDPKHCSFFVSVIGLSNAVGRILAGALAIKYSPLLLYQSACILAGFGTISYNFSFNLYYQYLCCVIFGLFISCASSLRSTVLVNLYGLDKLTNATGMMLMFQGFGSLIGTPVSSMLKNKFGYTVSFYIAGIVISMSGIVLFPVKKMCMRETESLKEEEIKNVSSDKPPTNSK